MIYLDNNATRQPLPKKSDPGPVDPTNHGRDGLWQCPTPWLGERRGYFTDWITQLWVRSTGRLVQLSTAPWLEGPFGGTRRVGGEFFEQTASRAELTFELNAPGAGLMTDFSRLRGTRFDPARVDSRIARFYERTTEYRLDAWSEWCGFFRPFGWMLAFLFSRRLQQLNVPIRPLQTSRGITSDIVQLREPQSGRICLTGWLRTFSDTGHVIYAGCYSHCVPPRYEDPCVKVVFPLPNGSATVVMKPEAHPDGSVTIASEGDGFGDAGFYFLVRRDDESAWVRYVKTMRERIHVFVDTDGELGADHVFRIFGIVFMRLHYRLTRKRGGIPTGSVPGPT